MNDVNDAFNVPHTFRGYHVSWWWWSTSRCNLNSGFDISIVVPKRMPMIIPASNILDAYSNRSQYRNKKPLHIH